MRAPALLMIVFGAAIGVAHGQIPDVRIQLDAIGSFVAPNNGSTQWRYYSLFGSPSVAALRFSLEPGFSAYVSERLQRIPHDGDPDQLDQAYVEDEGIWRLGKQVLPFGTTQVLRESAIAARADLNIPLLGVPFDVAITDAGAGRQRGIVGRIGPTSYGVSFAAGEHFGISGTSLTEIRLPSDSPGLGQGWNYAFGADITRRISHIRFRAEGVVMRQGVGPLDPDLSLLDLSASAKAFPFETLTVGYTREITEKLQIYRVIGAIPLMDHVTLSPFVRFRDARLWDIGFEAQIRF